MFINNIPKLDDLKNLAEQKGLSKEEYARLFIQHNTITAQEFAKLLGVSLPRITALKNEGKIFEIKKGLYLKEDWIKMRHNQYDTDAMKHSSKEKYNIIPAYQLSKTENEQDVIFVSKTRFSDCLVMADRSNEPEEYVKEIENILINFEQNLENQGLIIVIADTEFREILENIFVPKIVIEEICWKNGYVGATTLKNEQLFNWLSGILTITTNDTVIKLLEGILNKLINNQILQIKNNLIKFYNFSELNFEKNSELALYFTYDNTPNKLKVIKSTGRIAFENDLTGWTIDKQFSLSPISF